MCFIFQSGCDVASLCVYAALALSAAANIADSRQVIVSLAIVPRQKRYIFYGALTVPNLIHTNTNLQHARSPRFRRRSVPFGRRSVPFGRRSVPFGRRSRNLQHARSPRFRRRSVPFGRRSVPFGRRSVPFGRRSRQPFRRLLRVHHNSEGGPYHSEGGLNLCEGHSYIRRVHTKLSMWRTRSLQYVRVRLADLTGRSIVSGTPYTRYPVPTPSRT